MRSRTHPSLRTSPKAKIPSPFAPKSEGMELSEKRPLVEYCLLCHRAVASNVEETRVSQRIRHNAALNDASRDRIYVSVTPVKSEIDAFDSVLEAATFAHCLLHYNVSGYLLFQIDAMNFWNVPGAYERLSRALTSAARLSAEVKAPVFVVPQPCPGRKSFSGGMAAGSSPNGSTR
jgi:hypothetical protein